LLPHSLQDDDPQDNGTAVELRSNEFTRPPRVLPNAAACSGSGSPFDDADPLEQGIDFRLFYYLGKGFIGRLGKGNRALQGLIGIAVFLLFAWGLGRLWRDETVPVPWRLVAAGLLLQLILAVLMLKLPWMGRAFQVLNRGVDALQAASWSSARFRACSSIGASCSGSLAPSPSC
jgi:hypothetical protein